MSTCELPTLINSHYLFVLRHQHLKINWVRPRCGLDVFELVAFLEEGIVCRGTSSNGRALA